MGWDQPRQAFPVARGTLIVLEFRPRSAAIYSALTAFSERRNHILINSARTVFKFSNEVFTRHLCVAEK